MQAKAFVNTKSSATVVRRLGNSLSLLSILTALFAICCLQTSGASAMLSIKRFSVVQGRAGVRSFLQNNNYSPIRGNVLMMSTTAGADANAAPKKEKSKGKKKEGDSKYSKTVLLPITSFDQRANSLKRFVNDKPSEEYSAVIEHSSAVIG
jgi:hypothetical protein